MNLISCDDCGVVLDKDKLSFVSSNRFYKDDGSVDTDHAAWDADGRRFVAKVDCPVCAGDILNEGG